MVAKKAASKNVDIQVLEVEKDHVEFCLLGQSPIILNRMSEKAKQELLYPKGRKKAAEKAATLKHLPVQEYQDSPYINPDPNAPTYIEHLATAFKAAVRGAGVDMPGSSKAQLGRLMWVVGERVPIYGIPQMFCSVTRSADMNKTPDVRTRAIIGNWAAKIEVSFIKPLLNHTTITNLLAMAGLTQGIGDWRPQKGAGNYGQFQIVEKDNPQFKSILKRGGYKAQKEALESPTFYDLETEEIMLWWDQEVDKRGTEIPSRFRLSPGD